MAEKDRKCPSLPPCIPLNVFVHAWKPFRELKSAFLCLPSIGLCALQSWRARQPSCPHGSPPNIIIQQV